MSHVPSPIPKGLQTVRGSCQVSYLGLMEYEEAWDLQGHLGRLRSSDAIPDTLLLLEHPHTYTLGRTGNPSNMLLDTEALATLGAKLHYADRGGDVTYHGPGQLIGYPIMLVEDRRDLLRYIRKLEETVIRSLGHIGVTSHRLEGLSGVWIGDRKIAAVGVKMGRVTSHGFALNVTTDLSYFGHIIPCGIPDKGVTSIAEQLQSEPREPSRAQCKSTDAKSPLELRNIAEVVTKCFGEVFAREMVAVVNPLLRSYGAASS